MRIAPDPITGFYSLPLLSGGCGPIERKLSPDGFLVAPDTTNDAQSGAIAPTVFKSPYSDGGVGELVPSATKRVQWVTFLEHRDKIAQQRLPTEARLKALHFIFSEGYNSQLIEALKGKFTRELYYADRSEEDPKGKILARLLTSLEQQGTDEKWPLTVFFQRVSEAYQLACATDTQVDYEVQVRGELRSCGLRKIADGAWRRVYYPHTCNFDTEADEYARARGNPYPPPAYYGLSDGLDEVYGKMCAQYDTLRAKASTLEERIAAQMFLQLVGTRALHPFWDGNGRTFTGELILMLRDEGIEITEFDQARNLTIDLTPINDQFLKYFLRRAGLQIIKDKAHLYVELDMQVRRGYMQRLRRQFEIAIAAGLDPQGPFHSFYKEAAIAVTRCLTQRGLVTLDPTHEARFYQSIESNAVAIGKIEEPYRSYFTKKFREIYLVSPLFGHQLEISFGVHADKLTAAHYQEMQTLSQAYEAMGLSLLVIYELLITYMDEVESKKSDTLYAYFNSKSTREKIRKQIASGDSEYIIRTLWLEHAYGKVKSGDTLRDWWRRRTFFK